MLSPFLSVGLPRNPKNKNAGKFVTLSEFLELAKMKAVAGVLIGIQNAAYLASNKGVNIVDTVISALSNATFDKQSTQKVLIQSDDTSVLLKFKDAPTYQRVLSVKEEIGDAPTPVAEEVKKYADAITLVRRSIIQSNKAAFSTGVSNVVEEMHAANVSVYVSEIMNEYTNLLFDYFADPYVELSTFVALKHVDGVITDFPKSATAFMRTPCANTDDKTLPYPIMSIAPGDLAKTVDPDAFPPGEAPLPPLKAADVVDPPLPAVAKVSPPSNSSAPPPKSSSHLKMAANLSFSVTASLLILMGLLC